MLGSFMIIITIFMVTINDDDDNNNNSYPWKLPNILDQTLEGYFHLKT